MPIKGSTTDSYSKAHHLSREATTARLLTRMPKLVDSARQAHLDSPRPTQTPYTYLPPLREYTPMKPFDQLTDDELTSLTAEQFDAYADAALLESGIALLPEPAPITPIPAPQVFDVQAVSIGAMTIDPESAAQIQEIVNQGTLYYKNDQRQSLEPLSENQYYYRPSFDKQLCMSTTLARKYELSNKVALERQEQLRTQHRAYQDFLTEKAQTLQGLLASASSAENRRYKLHTEAAAKQRALEIAGGDEAIAQRIYETFLSKR